MNVTDEMMDWAVEVLSGKRHATARAAFEKLDRDRKVVLARLEREANEGSVQARVNYALTHPHYAAFLEQLALVESEYFEARDQRDSANVIFETWRTIQANNRAMEKLR